MKNHKHRKPNGSGYWQEAPNKWWAVVRETTINLLVGIYNTEVEAKDAYTAAQHNWDTNRKSIGNWKGGGNRYGDS